MLRASAAAAKHFREVEVDVTRVADDTHRRKARAFGCRGGCGRSARRGRLRCGLRCDTRPSLSLSGHRGIDGGAAEKLFAGALRIHRRSCQRTSLCGERRGNLSRSPTGALPWRSCRNVATNLNVTFASDELSSAAGCRIAQNQNGCPEADAPANEKAPLSAAGQPDDSPAGNEKRREHEHAGPAPLSFALLECTRGLNLRSQRTNGRCTKLVSSFGLCFAKHSSLFCDATRRCFDAEFLRHFGSGNESPDGLIHAHSVAFCGVKGVASPQRRYEVNHPENGGDCEHNAPAQEFTVHDFHGTSRWTTREGYQRGVFERESARGSRSADSMSASGIRAALAGASPARQRARTPSGASSRTSANVK